MGIAVAGHRVRSSHKGHFDGIENLNTAMRGLVIKGVAFAGVGSRLDTVGCPLAMTAAPPGMANAMYNRDELVQFGGEVRHPLLPASASLAWNPPMKGRFPRIYQLHALRLYLRRPRVVGSRQPHRFAGGIPGWCAQESNADLRRDHFHTWKDTDAFFFPAPLTHTAGLPRRGDGNVATRWHC